MRELPALSVGQALEQVLQMTCSERLGHASACKPTPHHCGLSVGLTAWTDCCMDKCNCVCNGWVI